MDWVPSKVKSLAQNVGAFVISNSSFTEVYRQPDHKSSSAADSLQRFCDDVGVPINLKTDRAKEFVERMTNFMKLVKKWHIKMMYAEPERKNQITRVDSEICDLKRRWHDKMRKKNAPERLWDHDYGLVHTSKIMQILPRSQLVRDRTALEAVTGKMPDISEFCDFDFYDLVWYHAGVHPGVGEQNREVGRWLGVSEHVGSDMCYWILSNNGKARHTPTMYYRKASKPDGTLYYELLLVYVDDVLAISHDPKKIMESIGKSFEIKNDEYGPPTTYLGCQLERFRIPGTNKRPWSLLSTQYVKAAVANVEAMLKEEGREFKMASSGKAQRRNPILSGYKPELDTTEECDPEHHSRFQQLIGILRWAVELGRIGIHIEVAIMSQYSVTPRVGHLEAVYCIFHYLKRNPLKRLVMDPATPVIDQGGFNSTADWAEFYGDVVEEDPPGMPEPLGKRVEIFAFCYSDHHASNVVTRRSHSGIFLFAQNALIRSFSKKQNTVETSTYGTELVAMRITRDMIVELRLKFKSIGIPMVGPANVFCDNQGVVKNTSIPESTLSKKHNSVNYHIVWEAAAAGILMVTEEDT
ncbi:hypothetical protein ACHAWF_002296, partial [Thalassiosira exigua]